MIGETRYRFDEITSTSDAARHGASQGAPDGSLYIAAHQTAGRGRRGARWEARPGESVLMTVLLYPTGDIAGAWRLGWVACIAVIEALRDFGIDAKCKWPNDVVVEGRKIAGILIETFASETVNYAALVGIGVNVLQSEFGDETLYRIPPTSIALELKQGVPALDHIVDNICGSLDKYCIPRNSTWEALSSKYRSSVILGMEQTGIDPRDGTLYSGVLSDVRDEDGAALLHLSDNNFLYVFPQVGGVA